MEIRLRNLKRNYGSLHAVDDVSLDIPSNTVYGIIGRSGAGKSTLVRLVSMLEKPDQGEVYYDSKRIDNLSKKELIEERGRLELPGRPLLYGTTHNFLRCMGISSLSELPALPDKEDAEPKTEESAS